MTKASDEIKIRQAQMTALARSPRWRERVASEGEVGNTLLHKREALHELFQDTAETTRSLDGTGLDSSKT